ncbi:MAG: MFS transporter, partial [Coriobacteriia bacterium]|nr:MFS transporter [Coriobacteriia bacterium]
MNEIKALLHNRNYVLYWLASMCSEFGSITLQFVISLYVFDLTGNSVLYGTLLFIAIVPRLVFYPLAGMLADRYDRRLLLLVPTGCAAIVLFAFTAIELFVMPLGVASLFVLVILLEVFNIFFMSANLSVPPMIVSRQQLGAANSMGILYSDFGYVIGMVVGALVYGLLGFTWSLLAISLCFALGFVFIIPLRLVQASNAAAQGARAGRAEAAALGDASTGEKSVGPRAAREPQVPAGAREPQVPA